VALLRMYEQLVSGDEDSGTIIVAG